MFLMILCHFMILRCFDEAEEFFGLARVEVHEKEILGKMCALLGKNKFSFLLSAILKWFLSEIMNSDWEFSNVLNLEKRKEKQIEEFNHFVFWHFHLLTKLTVFILIFLKNRLIQI